MGVMVEASRRALLAVRLLVMLAAATAHQGYGGPASEGKGETALAGFVPGPGGILRAPHVRVRPAVSDKPSGFPPGPARSAPPPGRARMPAAAAGPEHTPMWPMDFRGWQNDMQAAGGLPRRVGIDPVSLIDDWASVSEAAVAPAPGENDTAVEVMRGTRSALHSMRRSINAGIPGAVFALTDGSARGGGVQALATVTSQETPDDYFYSVLVLEIGGLVVSPRAARRGAVARELLRRISEWATRTGHTFTAAPAGEADGYYRSLGLEPWGAPWPRGALGWDLEGSGGPELDMVTLSSPG